MDNKILFEIGERGIFPLTDGGDRPSRLILGDHGPGWRLYDWGEREFPCSLDIGERGNRVIESSVLDWSLDAGERGQSLLTVIETRASFDDGPKWKLNDGERGTPLFLDFGERGQQVFGPPEGGGTPLVVGPPEGNGRSLFVGPPDGWGSLYFGPPENNALILH